MKTRNPVAGNAWRYNKRKVEEDKRWKLQRKESRKKKFEEDN